MNSFVLSHLIKELKACENARVEKIYQSAKSTLCFLLRGKDLRERLLVSANQETARLCLTDSPPEFPEKPPMFCMLLRKHLLGARFSGLSQPEGERIATLAFSGTTELGEPTSFSLVCEFFGGGNLILLDKSERIIDCSRRIDESKARDRVLMPGVFYTYPASGEREEKVVELPKEYKTYNEWLDKTLGAREKSAAFRSASSELLRLLANLSARIEKKLDVRKSELQAAEGREEHRRMGDIITANIYAIPAGAARALVYDYYTEEQTEISLDKRLSAAQNAEKYYKKYKKLANAERLLLGLIEEGERELEYIDSVFDALTRAVSLEELREIKRELSEQKYIKTQKSGKEKKPKALLPLQFCSPDGFMVLCGRNNLQNDILTMKTAKTRDVWCHAKGYAGSHVVVCGEGEAVSEEAIAFACSIAAAHSKAKNGSNVPVDYTLVKHVKKPAGARPGYVIYTNQKTMFVDPFEEE